MKKFYSICVLAIVFLAQDGTLVNAAIKPGSKCTTIGQTVVVSGKKITCIKIGSKKVWDKGATYKSFIYAEDLSDSEQNYCNLDMGTPTEWLRVEKATMEVKRCLPPFRYIPGKNIDFSPKTTLTEAKDLLNIEQCKIKDVSGLTSRYALANFGNAKFQSNLFTPTRNARVLVVGIQFTDVVTSSSPEQDFKLYTDFYTKFLRYSSDLGIELDYKFTPNYIKIGKSLKSYNLGDEHSDTEEFKKDFIAATDPVVDYSNIGQVLIVAPMQTHPNLLSAHMNWNSEWKTNEGLISSVYLHGPIMPTNPQIDRIWSVSPWITIHEAIGHQIGLDDHYGDPQVFSREKSSIDFKDYGAPTNQMAGAYGDFLAWDKWLSGLISDDQVRCAAKDKTTYHWIRPSSTAGKHVKAVVVPLAEGTALEIESFRSTGWNWKFPRFYSGLRVHLVDRTESRHGYGLYLLRSDSESGTRDGTKGNNFKDNLYDAALKLNESISTYGVKVTVLESGYYGDVVKIEKAN